MRRVRTTRRLARRVRVALATVGKWRRRFLEDAVAGLMDEPRAGAPGQVLDKQIEDVIVRTPGEHAGAETRRLDPFLDFGRRGSACWLLEASLEATVSLGRFHVTRAPCSPCSDIVVTPAQHRLPPARPPTSLPPGPLGPMP